MIIIENLSKLYKNLYAVDHLSAEISDGTVCIIGKNGAGKTTLLRMLSTQLRPTYGDAFINNLSIIRDTKKLRKTIVSIPQEASPIGILTPYEQIFMYLTARNFSLKSAKDETLRALRELDLYDKKDVPSDELSGGMKRKMFVAMALAANTETIFLDEPTTGLDPLSRLETWSAIKKLSGNIILTTHYMEEARELASKIYIMDKGRIIKSGNYDQLLRPYKNMIRIESMEKLDNSYKIGTLYVKYIKKSDIDKIGSDVSVRDITIDDLFIMEDENAKY
ncbi:MULTISPECIES: ABC transporter ATP-binding protein [Acidiplasma]|jgi:ABC-2 type transport system ATP-binding protein|uniref:Multidrug ABC transporter ATP-binding protein n=3 Tax=Acidiplasma TaxID=507753 RepID=A0A0Q0XK72_9ARCH|nr:MULTISPECIES: ABC transporter ATP-binding protein [Acidiplasma]KJE48650.1 multidrug ABC transporter ATPase [Acidiplasma sp. MBA-1]KPV47409.1 multidrug ABC transporter ATPase [Acidiplasma aeolicum]KQB35446.1 multidrug ABC transporter ATP-binding protein [Acidiplasma cupricumulans]KQB36444.1 multidrug ABC transporter ATP-binding protein [Acidiplasma aeolicum]WMT55409.1 MAG: ABC transporter ATP-binding protein [Acidiplasma sp.]